MLLWKMILAAASLKGRKACAQPGDAGVREIGKQALSGPFAGMEASLVEVSYPPGGRSAEHRHPGFIVGYVLEGHVPAVAVRRLLSDRPNAKGLAVPGMPIGGGTVWKRAITRARLLDPIWG